MTEVTNVAKDFAKELARTTGCIIVAGSEANSELVLTKEVPGSHSSASSTRCSSEANGRDVPDQSGRVSDMRLTVQTEALDIFNPESFRCPVGVLGGKDNGADAVEEPLTSKAASKANEDEECGQSQGSPTVASRRDGGQTESLACTSSSSLATNPTSEARREAMHPPGASCPGSPSSVDTAEPTSSAGFSKAGLHSNPAGFAPSVPHNLDEYHVPPEIERLVRHRARAEILRADSEQQQRQQQELQGEPAPQTADMQGDGPAPWGSTPTSVVTELERRRRWDRGCIVEVFSASLDRWCVARVADTCMAGAVTVRFLGHHGCLLQKTLPKNDLQLAVLGSHTTELPPDFRTVSSKSLPGRNAYLNAGTGLKYQCRSQAWAVYFDTNFAPCGTGRPSEQEVSAGQPAQAPSPGPTSEPPPFVESCSVDPYVFSPLQSGERSGACTGAPALTPPFAWLGGA